MQQLHFKNYVIQIISHCVRSDHRPTITFSLSNCALSILDYMTEKGLKRFLYVANYR